MRGARHAGVSVGDVEAAGVADVPVGIPLDDVGVRWLGLHVYLGATTVVSHPARVTIPGICASASRCRRAVCWNTADGGNPIELSRGTKWGYIERSASYRAWGVVPALVRRRSYLLWMSTSRGPSRSCATAISQATPSVATPGITTLNATAFNPSII